MVMAMRFVFNEVLGMKPVVWLGAALIAASFAAVADVKVTEEMSYEVAAGARISLENVNGDIQVVGTDGRTVRILAHKKAENQEYLDGLKVVVDASEDAVRIETRHPKQEGGWFNWGGGGNGSVAYELTVPRDVQLDAIETVNGDVSIRGVDGSVMAGTVNGELDAADLSADVGLETVNGSIEAAFRQLSGSQRVEAETVNGKIMLSLPGDASARLTAETVNGSIDAGDFGLETSKGFVGRDCAGDIGSGEARIVLDTVNGSIKVRKQSS